MDVNIQVVARPPSQVGHTGGRGRQATAPKRDAIEGSRERAARHSRPVPDSRLSPPPPKAALHTAGRTVQYGPARHTHSTAQYACGGNGHCDRKAVHPLPPFPTLHARLRSHSPVNRHLLSSPSHWDLNRCSTTTGDNSSRLEYPRGWGAHNQRSSHVRTSRWWDIASSVPQVSTARWPLAIIIPGRRPAPVGIPPVAETEGSYPRAEKPWPTPQCNIHLPARHLCPSFAFFSTTIPSLPTKSESTLDHHDPRSRLPRPMTL